MNLISKNNNYTDYNNSSNNNNNTNSSNNYNSNNNYNSSNNYNSDNNYNSNDSGDIINTSNSWQNDPALMNINTQKLMFISELARQMNGLPQDKMLPFLLAASKKSQSMNINFNDSEASLLLKVISSHMSPEERSRFEMLQSMTGMFKNKI